MIGKIILLTGASLALLGLSACSGAKKSLGLVKHTPDEFKIVKRAPLAMPPEYNIRPPRAGAPRPQENTTSEEARQVIFGTKEQTKSHSASSAEELFLKNIGVEDADPNIRDKVNQDLNENTENQQPIGTRLFGIGGYKGVKTDIVNAKEESARLHNQRKATQATTNEPKAQTE